MARSSMLCCARLWYLMPCDVMPRHGMLAMLRYSMLLPVMLRYVVMLCDAVLGHDQYVMLAQCILFPVMLCYLVSCFVLLANSAMLFYDRTRFLL